MLITARLAAAIRAFLATLGLPRVKVQQHIRTGGDLFVTLDADDFLKHGRREVLYSIGVWAFTPTEAVNHLRAWHPALREDTA